MRNLNRVYKRIVNESLKVPDSINIRNEIKWIKDLRNLPNGLKGIIQKFLNENDVHQSDCHFNSLKLSIFNPKVRRVVGYIGHKFGEEEIEFLNSNPKLKKLPNGLHQFEKKNGDNTFVRLYDLEKKMVYFSHSWNEFEGINFDITTYCENEMLLYKDVVNPKCDSKFIKLWKYYFESSKVDLRRIKHKGVDVLKVIKYVVENYPMEGIIMNRLIHLQSKNSFTYNSTFPNIIKI